MRLLRVIPSIDPRNGGTLEAARTFDCELIQGGHHIEVACLDSPASKFDYPAAVHALGQGRSGYGYTSGVVDWLRTNRSRFDAVLVDGIWQYHALATWLALAGTDTPYFVFTHGMLDPWFKKAYPAKHLKKWLYWPWADYRVLRDAAAVLFTCEEERRLARTSFWLYRCQEVVTAFGTRRPPEDEVGQMTKEFRSRHPSLEGKRILLYLGRVHEKKGCDLLVQAFARVAHKDERLHLVIAGPDQTGLVAKLQDIAHGLGLADRITWIGMLQGDAKWGAFHACEAFCLPSHQENFGIVVAEALGCGKPVLISNMVNIWREVESDGAGVVNDDTVEGTVRSLMTWIDKPADERASMGVAARNCFDRRFQVSRAAQNLSEIIARYVTHGVLVPGVQKS